MEFQVKKLPAVISIGTTNWERKKGGGGRRSISYQAGREYTRGRQEKGRFERRKKLLALHFFYLPGEFRKKKGEGEKKGGAEDRGHGT